MNDAVIVALIVGIASPAIMAALNNRYRRKDRLEDYARQDAVAEKVAAAAAEVSSRAALLVTSNQEVAATARTVAEQTGVKLDDIHVLVDGRYTAEMRRGLVALRGQLALWRRNVVLTDAAGEAVTPEDLAAIAAIEAEIRDMEAEIAHRVRVAP